MKGVDETLMAGCPVPASTLAAWQRHWAPPAQPFFVSDALVQRLPPWPRFTRREFQAGVSLSLHDTFRTYDVAEDPPWVVWLTGEAFYSLAQAERVDLLREQRLFGRAGVVHLDEGADRVDIAKILPLATDGLFVWWPQLWNLLHRTEQERVLRLFVEADRPPCRRDELGSWQRIATCLPGARALVGSFLPESGGNCLGTVMAAFGAPAVAERWVHPEPFERWLRQFSPVVDAARTAKPDGLGRVLVWRDENARVQHAAVSLGERFVLHKEAQSWYAPRQVSGLHEALARWRDNGDLSVYEPANARAARA